MDSAASSLSSSRRRRRSITQPRHAYPAQSVGPSSANVGLSNRKVEGHVSQQSNEAQGVATVTRSANTSSKLAALENFYSASKRGGVMAHNSIAQRAAEAREAREEKERMSFQRQQNHQVPNALTSNSVDRGEFGNTDEEGEGEGPNKSRFSRLRGKMRSTLRSIKDGTVFESSDDENAQNPEPATPQRAKNLDSDEEAGDSGSQSSVVINKLPSMSSAAHSPSKAVQSQEQSGEASSAENRSTNPEAAGHSDQSRAQAEQQLDEPSGEHGGAVQGAFGDLRKHAARRLAGGTTAAGTFTPNVSGNVDYMAASSTRTFTEESVPSNQTPSSTTGIGATTGQFPSNTFSPPPSATAAGHAHTTPAVSATGRSVFTNRRHDVAMPSIDEDSELVAQVNRAQSELNEMKELLAVTAKQVQQAEESVQRMLENSQSDSTKIHEKMESLGGLLVDLEQRDIGFSADVDRIAATHEQVDRMLQAAEEQAISTSSLVGRMSRRVEDIEIAARLIGTGKGKWLEWVALLLSPLLSLLFLTIKGGNSIKAVVFGTSQSKRAITDGSGKGDTVGDGSTHAGQVHARVGRSIVRRSRKSDAQAE